MPIEFRQKCGLLTRALGWHGQAFRGTDEAEVEEDLAEVRDNSSITNVEGQDTMPANALTQLVRHAYIVLSLIMRLWTVLH